MLKNIFQLLLFTCLVYGIFSENFNAKRLLTSHHIISYHIGHYNWIWASWKFIFTNRYNGGYCEVLLRKLMIFVLNFGSIFLIFWRVFSQKIKNHLCWRKSRHCNHKFPVFASEAKQSSSFYHQTYFTGLLRRISSFLAETCSISYSAGLHPAYNAKKRELIIQSILFFV